MANTLKRDTVFYRWINQDKSYFLGWDGLFNPTGISVGVYFSPNKGSSIAGELYGQTDWYYSTIHSPAIIEDAKLDPIQIITLAANVVAHEVGVHSIAGYGQSQHMGSDSNHVDRLKMGTVTLRTSLGVFSDQTCQQMKRRMNVQ